MNSFLTVARPDLWNRALDMATRLTGYEYAPKLPLGNGTAYACGPGGGYPLPAQDPFANEDDDRERLRKLREQLEQERRDGSTKHYKETWQRFIDELLRKRPDLKDQDSCSSPASSTKEASTIFVPEGAMEWLLHEVGHWIAATPEERTLANYGLEDEIHGVVDGLERIVVPSSGHRFEREWQAWAFEEIILAPFGTSRLFAPPTQRTGVAFAKAGPVPDWAMRHAERRTIELGVDAAEWRSLYGEWIRFERGLRVASWDRDN